MLLLLCVVNHFQRQTLLFCSAGLSPPLKSHVDPSIYSPSILSYNLSRADLFRPRVSQHRGNMLYTLYTPPSLLKPENGSCVQFSAECTYQTLHKSKMCVYVHVCVCTCVCVHVCVCMCVYVHSVMSNTLQPQLQLSGSSVHGIFQARILKWVAISRGSS